MNNLKEIVSNIPLYNYLYGSQINDIKIENLYRYPILERKSIIENFPNNWLSESLKQKLKEDKIEYTTTSGSSGQRIKIVRKEKWWREEYLRTYPFIKGLENFSIEQGRKAILTTAICSNTACYLDFPSFEQRLIGKTLYLNFHKDPNYWSDSDVERIIHELNTYKPYYLDADPVYLSLLIKKSKSLGLLDKIHCPHVLTLSYELVTSFVRKYIEDEFYPNPINLYGTTELGYLYVKNNLMFERCYQLSHVEFVPFNQHKNIYYLIVSSLKNEFMPFIRFRVGDLVQINRQMVGDDLNNLTTLNQFCGREKDVLFNDIGEPITLGEIDNILFPLTNKILIYQIKLLNNDYISFRYVSRDNALLRDSEQLNIIFALKDLLGQSKKITIKNEKAISVSSSGKFEIIKKD